MLVDLKMGCIEYSQGAGAYGEVVEIPGNQFI